MNYYKTLNKRAFEKRRRIANGQMAKPADKIHVGTNAEGGFRMISHLDVMRHINMLQLLEFAD